MPAAQFAPDGSPIPLYARLAPMGEPQLIHGAVPPGAEILELGAGAGRMTHGLLHLGHPVVAVDQSPEMLARVTGAETIVADIEALSLGRRFPVVVMASNFINDPEVERRRSYLACCARHVLALGQVLLEGFPRDWSPTNDWTDHDGVRMRLRSLHRDRALVLGEMEYVVKGQRYVHAFESRLLTDEELDEDLASVELKRARFLDDRGAWIEARPV